MATVRTPPRLAILKRAWIRFVEGLAHIWRDKLPEWWQKFAAIVGVFLLLYKLWGAGLDAYQNLKPSLSITPAEYFTTKPFDSTFRVKNTGHHPVHNVLANCWLISATSPTINVTLGFVYLSHYMDPIPVLQPGEETPVRCLNTMVDLPPPVYAHIALRVEYLAFGFWNRQRPPYIQRFRTEPQILDNPAVVRWEHEAMSEPMPSTQQPPAGK